MLHRSGVFLERQTGFEPATSSLARKRSTTELLPLIARCEFSALLCQILPLVLTVLIQYASAVLRIFLTLHLNSYARIDLLDFLLKNSVERGEIVALLTGSVKP